MKITNFLCCEYASFDGTNRVTIVAAGTDLIALKGIPAIARLFFFARCVADLNDSPGDRMAQLRLIGIDQQIGTMEVPFKLHPGNPSANIIVPIDLTIKAPGLFRFDLSIEGEAQVASWALEVRQA